MKQVIIVALLFGMLCAPASVVMAEEDVDITLETRSEEEIFHHVYWILFLLSESALYLEQEPYTFDQTLTIGVANYYVYWGYANDFTREEAQALCDLYAYDPQYMWELVTCTYDHEVLYRDVFIAG